MKTILHALLLLLLALPAFGQPIDSLPATASLPTNWIFLVENPSVRTYKSTINLLINTLTASGVGTNIIFSTNLFITGSNTVAAGANVTVVTNVTSSNVVFTISATPGGVSSTNAEQFGASTTLTIKDGVEVTNLVAKGTTRVTLANINDVNLTNALGSNQVRLGMAQVTNVHFSGLAEGHGLFYNAAIAKFTNAVAGSGSGSSNMVTAALGTLTMANSISFVVSNQANVGSWDAPAKTNYANAFYAQGAGTNRLGETLFDNSVTIQTNLTILGTTNQLIFGATNIAPASAVAPTKWVSVQITGESVVYRLPLYE